MNFDYIENEVLEISAFLQLLSHVNVREVDKLEIETLATLFATKADKLYCHIADNLVKEMQERA
ncbi:MAG: hypothetical protein RR630_10290 [Coprobacillus sp.]